MQGDSYTNSPIAPQTSKVIELQGHKAAEQALGRLLRADPARADFRNLVADALVTGQPLLTAIVRRLDSSSPQHFEALGRTLGAYPKRAEAAKALLRVVLDRRHSDNRRLGAAILLDHFLGAPPPADFLSILDNPVAALASCLTAALDGGTDKFPSLVGYLLSLMAQQPELIYPILGALAASDRDGAVEALRLLALQPDPDLMMEAIDALASQPSPHAIRALLVLEPNLPHEASRAVSRALQKLRLSGFEVGPLQEPTGRCRALLSPIDGRGNRLLWLGVPVRGQADRPVVEMVTMGLLLSDSVGMRDVRAITAADASTFPPPAQVGALHSHFAHKLGGAFVEDMPGAASSVCLEVPFGYGLAVLRGTVERNWATGTPLPIEYQLLNDLFWEYGAGYEEDGQATNRSDSGPLQAISDNEGDLLSNSLFSSWYVESEGVREVVEELVALDNRLPHELTDENWRLLLPALIRLAHDEFGPGLCARYADRLRLMSEWLRLAHMEREANLAASAAQTIVQSPPEANLFVLRLVQKGILVALHQL